MARIRPDVQANDPLRAGRPLELALLRYGLDEVVNLASNENPLPPFPEVQDVIGAAAARVNRYPDNRSEALRSAIAGYVGVEPTSVWIGAGSSEVLMATALAVGGAGTSMVVGTPSFAMYLSMARLAGSTPIEVPLDADLRLDLSAMAGAVREDTAAVLVCNPNNPTGTAVPTDAVAGLIDAVPEDVLVVIDEAYQEYVTAPGHGSAIASAVARGNVLVTRTFSKVFGLAGLRIGYGIGHPETIGALRRAQLPFTAGTLAQTAALEALRHPRRIEERVQANAEGRRDLAEALAARPVEWVESQASFIYLRVGADSPGTQAALLDSGVIVRAFADGWVRATVGTPAENRRFVGALDAVLRTGV